MKKSKPAKKAKQKKKRWVRPDWDELIPEAKTEDFCCYKCDNMKPGKEMWFSAKKPHGAICEACKRTDDRTEKTRIAKAAATRKKKELVKHIAKTAGVSEKMLSKKLILIGFD